LAGAAPAVASQAGIGSDRSFAKDNEVIQAQQATGGKVDLNSAPVVSTTTRCEPYLPQGVNPRSHLLVCAILCQ
jgi:hypothetical protein